MEILAEVGAIMAEIQEEAEVSFSIDLASNWLVLIFLCCSRIIWRRWRL